MQRSRIESLGNGIWLERVKLKMENRVIEDVRGRVTVAWGGDVNIGRRFHYCFHENNARQALAGIAPLRDADLGIVNLECVIATGGELGIDKGERASYYYRARPEMIEALLDGGVDLVATANNHSGDYGSEALMEQARWLDAAGIGYAGSGVTVDQAFRPVIRRVRDLNVALFSIDATQSSFAASETQAGHAFLMLSQPDQWRRRLEPLISEARKFAHVILVAVHWGENNRSSPDMHEIAVGHAIIESGADAVLGASAHMLQGIEIYRQRPIIHDAGDLLFDAIRREDKDTGVFTLELDHSGVRQVRFAPYEIGFCKTIPLCGPVADAAIERFSEKCAALGSHLQNTRSGEGVIELTPPARHDDVKEELPTPIEHSGQLTTKMPRTDWIVEAVPERIRLAEPIRMGPLELLGVEVLPNPLETRGLLFVESYWRLAEHTDEDWRLDFSAEAGEASQLGKWGVACDHDPCDWMWPTSRWSSGTIYRDRYSLRPPSIKCWRDETLQLWVGLKCKEKRTARIKLSNEIKFRLSPKEAFSVLRANPPKYHAPPKAETPPTPQILWDAQQLERITGGKWLNRPPHYWYIRSISHKSNMIFHETMPGPRLYVATDKRLVAKHELYSDLAGRHWDSHDRLLELQDKFEGGMVARPLEGIKPSLPLLQVDDPLHALMQLGVAGRERLRGNVVAITGSAGKTSLATMLTQAMSVDKQVQSNASTNYNSRVGLLHLLANTFEHTDLVVMETAVSAINAPGFQNIKLVRPNIVIVTNIAPSHLPPGKDLSYVAQRKANIFEGVAEHGWAVINRDTAHFEYLCKRARRRELNVLTYGQAKDADICLKHYDLQTGCVKAGLPDGKMIEYRLAANGIHMALNSLACVAVRTILGGDLDVFLPALEEFKPAPGRGQVLEMVFNGKSITVIDESYNANPLSMQMALSLMQGELKSGRKVLILGDMLELGDDAVKHHRDIALQIVTLKPDCLLVCGKLMRHVWEEIALRVEGVIEGRWYENVSALNNELDSWVSDGDRILVKGSNSVGLAATVDTLAGDNG